MVAAAGALVAAALIGAVLVFQPDAAASVGATHVLADFLNRRGVRYQAAEEAVGFSLNVALFVPGSFAAALLWPRVRWWQWVVIGLVVSLGIETVQGTFLPGRQAQVQDVVSNTIGAALGAGLVVVVRSARSTRS